MPLYSKRHGPSCLGGQVCNCFLTFVWSLNGVLVEPSLRAGVSYVLQKTDLVAGGGQVYNRFLTFVDKYRCAVCLL